MLKQVTIIVFLILASSLPAQWLSSLPDAVQGSILWVADHEEGTMTDWTMDEFLYAGGGIFNTGGAEVEAAVASGVSHSGTYSARASITNAWQSQNGARAVRLMRWTDRAWDDGGTYFPADTYYSTFCYFPESFNPTKYAPWDPGDGGWWNIFQFKSHDAEDVSHPTWALNVNHDDVTDEMSLYFYSNYNAPHSFSQGALSLMIPVGEWVHFECYVQASTPNTPDGIIRFWQDGELILEAIDVITTLDQGDLVWGIGNYTDHIDGSTPGSATLYFDDCVVSTVAVHPYLDSCPADINGDGEVGIDDFLLLNSSFGMDCDCAADLDGSGSVGVEDFLLFNSSFGEPCE